ncbi:MAG: GNAT family N-acetyltransferase [Clostridiales bacterium]|nr:GNAT family N-acetyltransferase [Clostridiales bacterium]
MTYRDEIIFDQADISDIDDLLRLRIEYMIDDFGSLSEADEAAMRSQLPGYYKEHLGKDLIAFVARKDGRIVGVAYLVIMEKPSSPLMPRGLDATVLSVFTEEESRGQGICSHLMRDLVDTARDRGVDRIELKATKDGYPVYKKIGFEDKVSHYTDMVLRFI